MSLDNDVLIKQVEELAKILKPWNDQLVIGGGVALILYDVLLSKANTGAVGTTDIDFLIPRKPIHAGDGKISKLLVDNGYEPRNKSMEMPAVQSFIKQIEEGEIEVEFLTDTKSRDKSPVVEIKDAGVNAQSLSYIEMSLQEAIPLNLPNGETILVVKPEAWVFHKGLTFPKRTVELKKYKDLYGIWFVLTQLQDTSAAAQRALFKLKEKSHESWVRTFDANLKKWVDEASPKDWDLLSQQDINGNLKQAQFQKLVSAISKH